MKKIISILITIAIMTTTIPVIAQGDIKVTLDGKQIQFDVQPQIINDYTMVPMRAIFESLGYEVAWDGDARTVTAKKPNTRTIKMTVGNSKMYVDDSINGYGVFVLDAPPQIIDERTLVPVRAIAEADGCRVDWDGSTRTVIIETPIQIKYYPGTDIPDIKSIIRNVQYIGTDVLETGDLIYLYKIDTNSLPDYVSFLIMHCGYNVISKDEEITVLGPDGLNKDYVMIKFISSIGAFGIFPCAVTHSQLPNTPSLPQPEPQGNNIDFADGIFDKISGIRAAYAISEYENKLSTTIWIEMPELGRFLQNLPQSTAEQLKSSAQDAALGAYRRYLNNNNLSSTDSAFALMDAYAGYFGILYEEYVNSLYYG